MIEELRLDQFALEITDYAIIILEVDGKIRGWNLGAERIKGYRAAEIIGKSFKVFYPLDDILQGKPDRLISQALSTGRVIDEGWRVKKDGSRFWGSVSITAIHNNEGDVIGFTKVTRDLTERKNFENELLSKNNELEAKNKELETVHLYSFS